jgi:hypothetical protein
MPADYIELVNKGKFSILSNSFITNRPTDEFPSVLHAHYHNIAKGDISRQEKILQSKTEKELCNALGPELYKRCSSITLFNKHYNYEDVYAVIWVHTSIKFYDNKEAVQTLISTGNAILLSMNGSDNVIGYGKRRIGLNISGNILMTLRDHFNTARIKVVERPIKNNTYKDISTFDSEIDYPFRITPTLEITSE